MLRRHLPISARSSGQCCLLIGIQSLDIPVRLEVLPRYNMMHLEGAINALDFRQRNMKRSYIDESRFWKCQGKRNRVNEVLRDWSF